MATYFENFTLDSGQVVTVEWYWDYDHVEIAKVFDPDTGEDYNIDIMTDKESERFDQQVLALSPSPPHDDPSNYGDYYGEFD